LKICRQKKSPTKWDFFEDIKICSPVPKNDIIQPEAKYFYYSIMDAETNEKLETLSKRVEEIYVSVEKTRKYFQWTLIITVITIVLPLIALVIIIPFFLNTITSGLGGI
jgi:hypothetical protein